ncbi:ATP-NAD kinase family protein [Aestuariivirga sp.]|jgi:predicted polyphosphate/ATP-dependent NAD kinase|uniref:ATP-NAD kinase family protein n=1 Tax=Aestuariivirga sp. TaxID=2650926 RepID=UPI0037851137
MAVAIGIIANPVSARDIRRVIANATALQITDRANIVLRVLSCVKACGVDHVYMMPENGGIRHHVRRGIDRAENQGLKHFPQIEYLDFKISGTVEDTLKAARLMKEKGAKAIVVLGGDGTHRAVVTACGDVPIAGISTGTNNAFPEHREPTITGLAVGLAVTGKVPPSEAFLPNKKIVVRVNDHDEIALVDVAVVTERYIGARALWRTETFRELFVTFADPEVIGMSAIAGLLSYVSRLDPGGLHVRLGPEDEANILLDTPIAPGYMRGIGIRDFEPMVADVKYRPSITDGSIALDGERELAFSRDDRVTIELLQNAFKTVNVRGCMHYASRHGLMRLEPKINA